MPHVNFDWLNECFGGGPVNFTSTSSGTITGASYLWNFGDGNTSLQKDPEHEFEEYGNYPVKLIVTTANHCIDSATQTIKLRRIIGFTDVPEYSENFNTGNGDWYAEYKKSEHSSWELGIPSAGNAIISENPVWCTNLNGLYNANEKSWVTSPCFNFTGLLRPMIKLDIATQMQAGYDGAVLQYSTNFGQSWSNIGAIGDGINWYNNDEVFSNPGNQQFSRFGWSQIQTGWREAKHNLDLVRNKPLVQFRFAFSSDASGLYEGFAFDNIWIGERARKVIVEHFTNTSSTSCATVNPVLNAVVNSNLYDAIDIQYHTSNPAGDPFFAQLPSVASTRGLYYGASSVPLTILNGTQKFNGSSSILSKNDILLPVLNYSPLKLEVDQQISGNSLTATVKIKALENIPVTKYTVHLVVIEKEVSGISVQNGEISFESVIRAMLPNAGGTKYNNAWTFGETRTITQTWNMANVANTDQLAVVAFIQDEISNEIWQAETTDTSYISTPITEFFKNSKNFNMLLYPNPASEKCSVLLNQNINRDGDLSLYDMTGKLILKQNMIKGSNYAEIEVENLNQGIYFVMFENPDGIRISKKLVIK